MVSCQSMLWLDKYIRGPSASYAVYINIHVRPDDDLYIDLYLLRQGIALESDLFLLPWFMYYMNHHRQCP